MDLADYLVYRASGNDFRSLCTIACKWTYLGHLPDGEGYSSAFFKENNLEDLFDNDRVPLTAHPIGGCAGELTKEAADQLGLVAGVLVGTDIIDGIWGPHYGAMIAEIRYRGIGLPPCSSVVTASSLIIFITL